MGGEERGPKWGEGGGGGEGREGEKGGKMSEKRQ